MGLLDFVDDAVDWVDDNIVDPIEENAEDVVDFIEENVVDTLVDAASDAEDWFEENVFDPLLDTVEDVGEWIEDVVKDVANAIENVWGEVAEFAEDLWTKIVAAADEAWYSIVDATECAWDWLTEKVSDAVDWLANSTEVVYQFIVKEAIPYIVTVLETIPAVIKALGAILVLPLCYLFKELFGEEEATIIEGIAAHEPRLMEEFKVARNPVNRKYAVFSDVHMYVEGDLDFFNNNGNSEIYRYALNHYGQNNHHLIEIGDVEDFWMRGGSSKGLILMISSQLPWPYYSEAFESSAFLSANQIHALNVFYNNVTTYATIRSQFYNKGRYTRVIGNHDDVWSSSEMVPIMDVFYPGADVHDYCTIENPNTEKTEIILAHGHQSDMFNMAMCNFAGKAITNLASVIHELSFREWNLFSKSKEEWTGEWNGMGFTDELQKIDLLEFVSFSEHDLFKGLEDTYGSSIRQPYLILGHTHKPKDNAGVPIFMYSSQWNWDEYSNSGTVGMWEEIVTGLEVDHPRVDVVAWRKMTDGAIGRYVLNSYRYGDTFLKA